AFTTPFLCVRGTGRPWNPAVQAWADANERRFAYEWHGYFRGVLPVKDDTAVTEDDVRRCNLVLFGDPGSNRWIGRVLPGLPLRWTRDQLQIGKEKYPAADHAPVLIQPNPLAEGRYVVLNSGHTFHEKELASLNYLLFPRLGDWAVFKVGAKVPDKPSDPLDEETIRAGFCDERWRPSEPAREAVPERLAPSVRPPAEFANELGGYRSPLKFQDGSPAKSADDWQRRREEILKTWHEVMGPWPALIDKPRIEYLEKERRDNVT